MKKGNPNLSIQEGRDVSYDLHHHSTHPQRSTSSQRIRSDLNNLLKKNSLDGRRLETGSGYLS